MSTTPSTPGICNCCKNIVAGGTGTLRQWNGAARRFAPKYAIRSAYGILAALRCVSCESYYVPRRKRG